MDNDHYHAHLTESQAVLRARGAAIYERGLQVRNEYNEAIRLANLRHANLGLPKAQTFLTIEVRLRAGRPFFGWRRTKYASKKRLRTLPCKSASLRRHTNDVDHALVMHAEQKLEALRKLWKQSHEIAKAIKILLHKNEIHSVGLQEDPSNHFPVIEPIREAGSIIRPGKGNRPEPRALPAFKADEDL